MGVEWTLNKNQNRKLALEKKNSPTGPVGNKTFDLLITFYQLSNSDAYTFHLHRNIRGKERVGKKSVSCTIMQINFNQNTKQQTDMKNPIYFHHKLSQFSLMTRDDKTLATKQLTSHICNSHPICLHSKIQILSNQPQTHANFNSSMLK